MSTDNQWLNAEVSATTGIADRIRRITLRFETPQRIRPGEHLKVRVETDGGPATRSYSIVDASADGLELSLSVFHTPHSRGGSTFMHALTPGERLRVSRPVQNFPLRIGAPEYVLVAGGIGITALRGMADLLRRLGANYTIHYAARSPDAMAYRTELEAEHGAKLRTYFDSEQTLIDVPAVVGALTPGAELYMCGPIRLMDAIRRSWHARELDPTNLRFETFGNSGWFTPQRFSVEIPRLGVSTEIGQNESILEALEKIGVEMMSDCRRGECGLCQVKVLDTQGRIDHRDVFFSDRQKSESAKLCACVSRVAADPTATGASGAGVADGTPTTTPVRLTIDVP